MTLLDLLFPKTCVSCGRIGSYICPDCFLKIKTVNHPICPVCQKPSIGGKTHYSCQRPLALDGLTSLFSYSGPIKKALRKIKFDSVFAIVPSLARLAEEEIEENEVLYNFLRKKPVVVPIPLHWLRENRRGFNQAAFFAKLVAQKWDLAFWEDLLIRKKYTLPQARLKKEERKENVKGVFQINKKFSSNFISQFSRVLLVDDVWTTGATMREAGKVLKRRGVKEVWALTLARGGG